MGRAKAVQVGPGCWATSSHIHVYALQRQAQRSPMRHTSILTERLPARPLGPATLPTPAPSCRTYLPWQRAPAVLIGEVQAGEGCGEEGPASTACWHHFQQSAGQVEVFQP